MNRIRIALTLFACCAAAFSLSQTASQAVSNPAKQVTFTKDVAPIFFKQCADCHRPGEAAPFSVLSYKAVRPWAKSIKEQVTKREMPPWDADPHVGQWANDRRLSQAELDTITAWVDQGAKEGNVKDMPAAPKFVEGWTIGKPDIVVPMNEEFTVTTGNADQIQYFTVEPGFKEDVYVQAAEARPGNRQLVHHIIAFIQPPQKPGTQAGLSPEERRKARLAMEEKMIFFQDGTLSKVKADAPVFDDACSIPSGGGGAFRDGTGSGGDNDNNMLCGYAPGMNQLKIEPGTVRKIAAGSKIVFQLHYSSFLGATGVQKDRSSVGLVLAKQPPSKLLHTKGVANHYFKIPAGAENHRSTACWTVPEDVHILTFMPHLHLRGTSMKFEAFYPDGRKEVICNVPKYDFNWQIVYYAAKPVALPKGTRILVTTTWDNSAKNKFNPDPKKDVRWGDPTYEEMTIGWMDYTIDRESMKSITASNGGGSEK